MQIGIDCFERENAEVLLFLRKNLPLVHTEEFQNVSLPFTEHFIPVDSLYRISGQSEIRAEDSSVNLMCGATV